MVERTPVILGLTRQAKLYGLPLPYFLAIGALIMFPFVWTQWLPWVLTAPLWYGAARIATVINPYAHRVVAVLYRRTPPPLALKKEKRVRRYV